jgi:hypothetical protein
LRAGHLTVKKRRSSFGPRPRAEVLPPRDAQGPPPAHLLRTIPEPPHPRCGPCRSPKLSLAESSRSKVDLQVNFRVNCSFAATVCPDQAAHLLNPRVPLTPWRARRQGVPRALGWPGAPSGPARGIQAALALSAVNRFCTALLYGCDGRLTAIFGGFRLGQWRGRRPPSSRARTACRRRTWPRATASRGAHS